MHKTGISYICRTKTIYLFESEQSRIIQNFDCSQKKYLEMAHEFRDLHVFHKYPNKFSLN